MCFVYNAVHHFKQHNSSGRTKLKEESEKDKGVSILMHPLSFYVLYLKLMQLVINTKSIPAFWFDYMLYV